VNQVAVQNHEVESFASILVVQPLNHLKMELDIVGFGLAEVAVRYDCKS
jgi:hypothetical protein